MKLKHYIMKHDGTNYLYVTPLQNQGLVLALLLRAQVCLYGFCDTDKALPGSAHIPSVATGVRPHTKRSKIGDRGPVHVGTWYAFTAM